MNHENVVPGVCSMPTYTRTSNKVTPTSTLATNIRAPNLRMSMAIGYDDLLLLLLSLLQIGRFLGPSSAYLHVNP
jgi:hypothetical protein